MARVVSIRVPEGVSEGDIVCWIAEGFSRRLMRKLILRHLKEGVGINLEKALREFEETRSEVWKNLEEEYRKKRLL